MRKAIPSVIAAAALVAGLSACGGGANAGDITAGGIAKTLGCPNAKVSTKQHPNEPAKKARAECNGTTVMTFSSQSDRDTYVKMTLTVNKAFGQDYAALVGDDWAVFGSPSKVKQAKAKIGSGTVKNA